MKTLTIATAAAALAFGVTACDPSVQAEQETANTVLILNTDTADPELVRQYREIIEQDENKGGVR